MPRIALVALATAAAALFGALVVSGGESAIAAAHRGLDRQIDRAGKDVAVSGDALSRDALAVAADVARSEALQAALGERVARGEMPDSAALDAAGGALAARPASDGRSTLLVLVTERGFAESRLGEAPRFGDGPRVTAAADALGGKPSASLAVVDDRMYRVAAAPVGAGQKPLGAVVIGFPVDDAYASKLAAASGAEVSIVRAGKVVASTLAPAERAQVGPAAGRGGMLPFGFGSVPDEAVALGPMRLRWMARGAAAERAAAAPVPGVEDARIILSMDESPTLGAAFELQRRGVLGGAGIFVFGLLLLPLARGRREPEPEAAVFQAEAARPHLVPAPEPLAEPEPDFVPSAPSPIDPIASSTDPFGRGMAARVEKTLVAPLGSSSPPMEATQPRPHDSEWPDAFAGLPEPAAATPEPPTVIAFPGHLPFDPFATVPTGAPSRQNLEATRVAPEPPPTPDETRVALVPEALLKATSRAAETSDPETAHFQQVFREFLDVRRHCGEPVDGITFDRFVVKLRKNRDQLVDKYHCRSVRFTVYVKDGKAALKATPVRD